MSVGKQVCLEAPQKAVEPLPTLVKAQRGLQSRKAFMFASEILSN